MSKTTTKESYQLGNQFINKKKWFENFYGIRDEAHLFKAVSLQRL